MAKKPLLLRPTPSGGSRGGKSWLPPSPRPHPEPRSPHGLGQPQGGGRRSLWLAHTALVVSCIRGVKALSSLYPLPPAGFSLLLACSLLLLPPTSKPFGQ